MSDQPHVTFPVHKRKDYEDNKGFFGADGRVITPDDVSAARAQLKRFSAELRWIEDTWADEETTVDD